MSTRELPPQERIDELNARLQGIEEKVILVDTIRRHPQVTDEVRSNAGLTLVRLEVRFILLLRRKLSTLARHCSNLLLAFVASRLYDEEPVYVTEDIAAHFPFVPRGDPVEREYTLKLKETTFYSEDLPVNHVYGRLSEKRVGKRTDTFVALQIPALLPACHQRAAAKGATAESPLRGSNPRH